MDDESTKVLTAEQCWVLLDQEEFGRLAYRLVDEVHVVPINYVTDGRSVVFRTAAGSKLFAAALGTDVAFEIDWHDDQSAWSVVVRGRIRILGEDEEHRADSLPLRPWVSGSRPNVVELSPDEVTGRWFRLGRAETDGQLIS